MTLTIAPPQTFSKTGKRNVGVFPTVSALTVAQAAELIGEKEGLINDLLKLGLVKFRLENGERLVQQDSLLEYESRYQERLEGLAEIAREWQEMGLYDD